MTTCRECNETKHASCDGSAMVEVGEDIEREDCERAARGHVEPAIKAYDMSKYQRLVGVDGKHIRGTFFVSLPSPGREAWVKTHDVVIWDEGHYAGRCLYSNDLTGSVKDGVAHISKHSVAARILPDVEEVWDEMLAVLVAVVEAAQKGPSE